MGVTDTNEVHAYIRVLQDPNALQEIADRCKERVAFLENKNRKGLVSQNLYVQETNHTDGGVTAPPAMGPSTTTPVGARTNAEQAEINNRIARQQIIEGRTPGGQPPGALPTPDADAVKAEGVKGEGEGEAALAATGTAKGGGHPEGKTATAEKSGGAGKQPTEGKHSEGTDKAANPGHGKK